MTRGTLSIPRLAALLAGLTLVLGWRSVDPPFDHGHSGLAAVLDEVLEEELVDYAALRRAPEPLDSYLAALASVTPRQVQGWSRAQRFAFWINAYNAFTLQLVRDEGPVKSIKEIGGWFGSPWRRRFIPLGSFDPKGKGRRLSLDDIEHRILRPGFKDARLHAAVNCASRGCPPLRPEPYQAATLERQLTEQARSWLLDRGRNDLRVDRGAVRVSRIFDWYEEDFGDGDAEVVGWIASQLEEGHQADALRAAGPGVKVRYLDYDWGINALPERR